MASDLIMARTSALTGAAPKFATHAGLVTDMSGTVQSFTSDLTGTMSSVPELGSFSTNVETVGQNLKVVMQCHSDALMRTHQGLLNTAKSFETTDLAMSQTFNAVATQFQGFTGYETPITTKPDTLPIVPPIQPQTNPPNIIQNVWGWITTHV